ncbi:hypothetical protein [Ferrimicrobium sp.]|uniref:hypothetical protein n=1 Tax=Ferrimicrobium sp. TaxID=2926050 RepID=UPI0026301087|nr:hypothetical protein [Ferrimicrobium sp.]
MSKGNAKEIEMQHWDGWYGLSKSLQRELFGSGPRNDHDRLRFRVLNEEDRARTNVRARELFVRTGAGELPSIAFCWRTALDETYAAKGVVMKLRRRDRGLSDPILVPAPGANEVCGSCGRPVARA